MRLFSLLSLQHPSTGWREDCDVWMTDTRADEAERSRWRRQLHEDEIECFDLCFLVFFLLRAGDGTSTAGASAGGEEIGAGGEAMGVVVGAGTGGEFVGAVKVES